MHSMYIHRSGRDSSIGCVLSAATVAMLRVVCTRTRRAARALSGGRVLRLQRAERRTGRRYQRTGKGPKHKKMPFCTSCTAPPQPFPMWLHACRHCTNCHIHPLYARTVKGNYIPILTSSDPSYLGTCSA
jgi:hypothetical protein